MEGTIRPSIRLTLEKEERFFGPGVADLKRELGYPLLSSHNGGTAGGKSELTEKGKWFLQQYREMEEALRRKMEDVFREYFPAE